MKKSFLKEDTLFLDFIGLRETLHKNRMKKNNTGIIRVN